MAELEGHPEGARRLDLLGVGTDEADAGGREAGFFDVVGQDADGARAARSDGKEQDPVHVVLFQERGYFPGRGGEFLRGMGAADRVMEISQ